MDDGRLLFMRRQQLDSGGRDHEDDGFGVQLFALYYKVCCIRAADSVRC